MADRTWKSGASGSLTDAADWTPNGAPQAGETDAILDGAPTATGVTLDGYTLQLGAASSAPTLGLANVVLGSELTLTDVASSRGWTADVTGTLTNEGRIVALSGSGVTAIQDSGAASTFVNAGGGRMSVSNGSALELQTSVVRDDGSVTGASGGLIQIGLGAPATSLTGTGSFTLSAGASFEDAGTAAAGVTVAFADGAGDEIILDQPADFASAVTGFSGADGIDLVGLDGTGKTYDAASQTLTVTDASGGQIARLHVEGAFTTGSFALSASGTDTLITLACYAAGTRVAAEGGPRAVEDLRPRDRIVLVHPATGRRRLASVRWAGRRTLDVARHPRPDMVAPVRVARGAIAPGVPEADLLVSPDHAIWIDGVLIPARLLRNGGSITQDLGAGRITYVHLETARHGLMLAEGLTAETYLDAGRRSDFEGQARTLHPDFAPPDAAAVYAARGVAKLTTDAASVQPVWARLAARSAALGLAVEAPRTTSDAAPRLRLGGRTHRPVFDAAGRLVFAFAPCDRPRAAVLASRSDAPSELAGFVDDRRLLGLAVSRLGATGAADLALDGPALGAGWHATEQEGGRSWRWTDGAGAVAIPAGATGLDVRLHARGRYRVTRAA